MTTTTEPTIDLAEIPTLTEAEEWHRQLAECAAWRGDSERLALRWGDAEALRLEGMKPARAAMVLL